MAGSARTGNAGSVRPGKVPVPGKSPLQGLSWKVHRVPRHSPPQGRAVLQLQRRSRLRVSVRHAAVPGLGGLHQTPVRRHGQGHAADNRRIHSQVAPARSAKRLHPHPPLRIACQSLPGGQARPVQGVACPAGTITPLDFDGLFLQHIELHGSFRNTRHYLMINDPVRTERRSPWHP